MLPSTEVFSGSDCFTVAAQLQMLKMGKATPTMATVQHPKRVLLLLEKEPSASCDGLGLFSSSEEHGLINKRRKQAHLPGTVRILAAAVLYNVPTAAVFRPEYRTCLTISMSPGARISYKACGETARVALDLIATKSLPGINLFHTY